MLAPSMMLAVCGELLFGNSSVNTSGNPEVLGPATIAPVAVPDRVKFEKLARAPEGAVAATVTVTVRGPAGLPLQDVQVTLMVATVTVPVVSRLAPGGAAGDCDTAPAVLIVKVVTAELETTRPNPNGPAGVTVTLSAPAIELAPIRTATAANFSVCSTFIPTG